MTDPEIEHVLDRYRAAGPPPELRARIVGAAVRRPAGMPSWREWTPVAAAVVFTVLFYWLGARQRGTLESRLAAPNGAGMVLLIDAPRIDEAAR